MPHTKKKIKSQLSKKRVALINPREYTLMGSTPQFVHFNPSGETYAVHPISHRLEKWILIILLAFAMAAFMGFKFLENSDFSFGMNDTSSTNAAHSINNDAQFKDEFNKNRKEARSLMQEHTSIAKKPITKPKVNSRYAVKKSKSKATKVAARKSTKKKITSKVTRKKTIARR